LIFDEEVIIEYGAHKNFSNLTLFGISILITSYKPLKLVLQLV